MVVAANFTWQITQNTWAASTIWTWQRMKPAFWMVTWELLARVKCVSPVQSVRQADALCLDDRYEKLISQFSEGVLKPKIKTRCATKKSSVYYKVLWNSPREASKQKQPCFLATCTTKQVTAWLASDGAGFGLCSGKEGWRKFRVILEFLVTQKHLSFQQKGYLVSDLFPPDV